MSAQPNTVWGCLVIDAPRRPGLYSVWAGEELLYVGLTSNLRMRLVAHNKRIAFMDMNVSKVYWFECSGVSASNAEHAIIAKYKPKLCKQSKWGLDHCAGSDFVIPSAWVSALGIAPRGIPTQQECDEVPRRAK